MARPASDIAERILHAARERFLDEGVDGASLRAIARDAGTNLGMVYYYYPTKDELFFAVVEEVYAELLAAITRILSDSAQERVHSRIARLYAHLAGLSDDELKVARLILREAIGTSSQRLARLFERFSRGHVPLILGTLQQGIARGEVRSDMPPALMMLITLVLGVGPQVMRRRLAESGVPVDALLPPPADMGQALARVLFAGIGASAPPTDPPASPPALVPNRQARSKPKTAPKSRKSR